MNHRSSLNMTNYPIIYKANNIFENKIETLDISITYNSSGKAS